MPRDRERRAAVEALHRITLDEYRRLIEAGVFDEDTRIELIYGLLVDMSLKTRAHENAIAWDKPPIYAQAGIPVYWAVDRESRRAVATQPAAG